LRAPRFERPLETCGKKLNKFLWFLWCERSAPHPADRLPPEVPLIRLPPSRSPHHTISHARLVGGGNWPHPGEISLAHRGVLFLDELPEFGLRVLEVMRQPIEDKVVTISRAQGSLTFPANFQLSQCSQLAESAFIPDRN